MKTPLSWISLYTPLTNIIQKHSITELAHLYSIHTAEVDDIIPHNIDRVVVGKVLSCEKHPDSKKLSIVRVGLGEHGEETILTGAANIVDAKYVPVAMVGAVLWEDFEIGERVMAGMMSRGMICSDDELGLASERSDGIMILERYWDPDMLESQLGTPFFDLTVSFPGKDGNAVQIPLKDTTFEIDNKFITNRPDLFSVTGNAREWAAIFGETYTPVVRSLKEVVHTSPRIQTEDCLAYSLVEMSGLSVGTSPFGVQIMMERAGLKPKFDLVDITNLIMTECGQPMHAFDADKVQGEICVRKAHTGETLHALNDVTYTLTEDDIVIADNSGPIALAGVIGGMNTAVSETTTRVFWESATFRAATVRLTAQRHAIRTDASTRYEKSLDPLLAHSVFARVDEYLAFLGKTGSIQSEMHYSVTVEPIEISLPFDRIDARAGVTIAHDTSVAILEALGFTIRDRSANNLMVVVPSWRATKDVSIAEDVIEEVLRIYGYDNIPAYPLSGDLPLGKKNTEKMLKSRLLQYFAERWWNEVYNYSFTNEVAEKGLLVDNMDEYIRVLNAYTEDLTHLRYNLAHGLFDNIRNNIRHRDSLSFFEIGSIYGKNIAHEASVQELLSSQDSSVYGERRMIAGVCTPSSIQELRKELEILFVELIGYVPVLRQGSTGRPSFLHPGLTGHYSVADKTVATFGKIHPSIAENYEIPENTWYFEMDFETLHDLVQKKDLLFKKISVYQAIPRELNFILPENAETGLIAREIFALHPWITPVFIDSVYRDAEKIGSNKKSVNFSFTLQSMTGTINDTEAQEIQTLIIDTMAGKWYPLRSM